LRPTISTSATSRAECKVQPAWRKIQSVLERQDALFAMNTGNFFTLSGQFFENANRLRRDFRPIAFAFEFHVGALACDMGNSVT
jgi:hypothetical protein